MEEELSVTNTNVADEHLWALSFINVMFVLFSLVT